MKKAIFITLTGLLIVTSGEVAYAQNINSKLPAYTELSQVSSANAAKIHIISEIYLEKGDVFDPFMEVVAIDSNGYYLMHKLKVVENNVDTTTVGQYKIAYEVTGFSGEKVRAENKVNVVDKVSQAPTDPNDFTDPAEQPMIFVDNMFITQGQDFHPLDGVIALDSNGRDISSSIQIVQNTVNKNTPGDYKVVYEVTGYNGVRTRVEIKVSVMENITHEPNVSTGQPTIYANDINLTEGDRFDPLENVIVMDSNGQDITNSLKVIKNTVNSNKSGSYKVTYQVTGYNQKVTEKTIAVKVNEMSGPTIEARDIMINQGDNFNPLLNVEAYDGKHNNITQNIVVKKNEVNTKIPGNYVVSYEILDEAGKKATATINVMVLAKSSTAPILFVGSHYVIQGATFDPLANVTAFDLEDGNLTSEIVVVRNNVNTKVIGTYEVEYAVTDSDGNKTTQVVQVKVIADKPATIFAEDKVLRLGEAFDPLDGVTASDSIQGDISSLVEVKYSTVLPFKKGTYTVVYTVTNFIGKTTEKTITVTII